MQKYVGEVSLGIARERSDRHIDRSGCSNSSEAIRNGSMENEVQRTMLELINQSDGFDPRGNIKVLVATNRAHTLDPAFVRPGRLDRKVEYNLPELEVNRYVLISMPVERANVSPSS